MGGHSYHSNYSGGRRVHYGGGGGGGGDCSCATLAIYGITFLVTLLIVYIIVISIKFPKASDKATAFSLSETRIIKIESTWFDKFSLGPVGFKDITVNASNNQDYYQDMHLLRFKKRPPLTKSDTWNLTEPDVTITDNNFYYWSWYLYAGSSIKITWDYNIPITVYFVKGTSGYSAYEADSANFYKHIEDQYETRNRTVTQAVTKDDIYFVIFENWESGSEAKGSAFFTLNSRILDVSNPDYNCTLPCTETIKYGDTDVFVVTTPLVSEYQQAGKGSPNTELSTNFRKYSRVGFIVGVVYILPILGPVVIIVVAILIYAFSDEIGNLCKGSSSSSSKGLASSSSTASDVPMSTITISSPMHAEPTPYSPTPGAVVDPYPLPPVAPSPAPLGQPNPFDSPQFAPPYNPDGPPPSAPPSSDPYPPPPPSEYPPGEAPPPM